MTVAERNMIEEMAWLFNMDIEECEQKMRDAGCVSDWSDNND